MADETKQILLSAINKDRRTQLRVETDGDQVQNLRAAMEAGQPVPPIDVFHAGDGTYIIADGFHRFIAASDLAKGKADATIAATIHDGGYVDALKFALGANAAHGLRRTNKDKRHAVEVACKEFPTLSNRAIADLCKVGASLVNDIRPQLPESGNCRTGKDGKKYHAKAAQPAQQMDFFARLSEDFDPVVKTVDAILKQPYWLEGKVKPEEKLEGIESMRKRIKDLDTQLADRAAAIKRDVPKETNESTEHDLNVLLAPLGQN